MKYRRLTDEELKDLEQDFVQFLVANTVTADDWVKIKEESPEKAEQLIQMFSDIVMEKVLENTKYLEYKEAQDMKLFYCMEDKIVMMGMYIEGHSKVDFRNPLQPVEMMASLNASGAKLKLYQAEKPYSGDKKEEIFKMIQAGCLISKEGELFHLLESLKGEE